MVQNLLKRLLMTNCFFVSDLHGKLDRYQKLIKQVSIEKPQLLFFGGDLLPHGLIKTDNYNDFALDCFFPELRKLKQLLKDQYPEIFLILGNDDARSEEQKFIAESNSGLFHYINQRKHDLTDWLSVYGYSFVPPTPFLMKDWEKYDVSRYVDPGCVHPMEGFRTTETVEDIEYATIQNDLERLTENEDVSGSVFLFHSPPYKTNLDRAGLDGQFINHVPVDVNIGSIAIKRFIEVKQPNITLHGHVHESTGLTGKWMQKIGKTFCFNAAHDGPQLSIIKFSLECPDNAIRILD